MIHINLVYLGLLMAPLVALVVSIIVESPLGVGLRFIFAGENFRANADGFMLPPRWPWLCEAMQCVKCVSFWVAAGVYFYFVPKPVGPLEGLLGWSCAYLGARLVLGLARLMEYHGGD